MYVYSFFGDFVLLYPVYTLLFADTGLSIGQISSLFVLWCVAGLAFEVPSGALADVVPRRLLLVLAPLLTAVAFALWVAAPSYWMFALGFVLWGLRSALTSGSLEALVYGELERLGAEAHYATLMGRGEVAGVTAAMLSGAAAAPTLAMGGYPAVGAASVAVCLCASSAAMMFPENRIRAAEQQWARAWSANLAGGIGEVRHSAKVRSAVILVVVVTAIWAALDEYTPLLLSNNGFRSSDVPLLMVVVWAGAALGGLAAGRFANLGTTGVAVLIATAAVLLAVGALVCHTVGVLALAGAFGMFQLATIVTDARLQHSITGEARATVTSVAGMSTEVGTLAVYGSYAVAAAPHGHPGAFIALALPYLVVAGWLAVSRRK